MRRTAATWVFSLALSLLGGCADGGAASDRVGDVGDDASDATASACPGGELEGICLPTPPAGVPEDVCASGRLAGTDVFHGGGVCLPNLTDWPCPEGWSSTPAFLDAEGQEDAPSGLAAFGVCEPPVVPGACPTGFMPRFGRADCVRQGQACPAQGQRWHDETTIRNQAPGFGGRIVYVAPDGADSGTGSPGSPFQTIERAIAAAGDGGIVALAAGRYAEVVDIRTRVAVTGSCVEGTTLTAPGPSADQAIVQFVGPGAAGRLSDVTVTGERLGIAIGNTTGDNVVASVLVRETRSVGVIAAAGARGVHIVDTVIEETRPVGDRNGRGLVVQAGASLRATRVLVQRSREFGAFAADTSSALSLEDVIIRETLESSGDQSAGRGVGVQGGARLDASRVVIENSREIGLFASEADTSVALVDVVVRNTVERASDGELGRGIHVQEGARLTASRLIVDGNRDTGIYAGNPGTTVVLDDTVVRGTREQARDGSMGRGVHVDDGADLSASRLVVDGNRDVGVLASGTATQLGLDDTVVRNTRSEALDDTGGRGVQVQQGAAAVAARVLVERNLDVGVVVTGLDTSIDMEDVVIRDTQSRVSDGAFGSGIFVQNAASARAMRLLAERNRFSGVVASLRGARVTLHDAAIIETQAQERDGTGGRGIEAQAGATIDGTRIVLARNREVGVLAGLLDATLSLEHVAIRETLATDCSEHTTRPCSPGGIGVLALRTGTTTLSDFHIDRSHLVGVQIAADGHVSARDGTVSNHPIAVNAQVPGFDVDAAFVNVRLLGNEVPLSVESLPVPGVLDLLADDDIAP